MQEQTCVQVGVTVNDGYLVGAARVPQRLRWRCQWHFVVFPHDHGRMVSLMLVCTAEHRDEHIANAAMSMKSSEAVTEWSGMGIEEH